MAKMTKKQVKFRCNQMKKSIAFLMINSPDCCKVTANDFDAINRIADKYLKQLK